MLRHEHRDAAAAARTDLSTKQAAECVGLRPQTLRWLKCEVEGPQAFKQGRLNVYYPADLDDWLAFRLIEG